MLSSFPIDRQLDMMDCGPSCLKMIAKYYGKFYSLQYLRDKCGLSREGVSFLDLSYAAENIGLRTLCFRGTVEDLYLRVALPCIIHWADSHFVVVYKVTANKVFIADPAKGLISLSYKSFIEHWYKSEALRINYRHEHGISAESLIFHAKPAENFQEQHDAEIAEKEPLCALCAKSLRSLRENPLLIYIILKRI